MTSTEYRDARKKRGTQHAVAAALGVHQVTIARRETGVQPINREAELALLALPQKTTPRPMRPIRPI
jgi:transcriptional regulator with XRE-family HTH domain